MDRGKKLLEYHLNALVKKHPVGVWLLSITGVGPVIAAILLGSIGTRKQKVDKQQLRGIACFQNPSKLWSYSGLNVIFFRGKNVSVQTVRKWAFKNLSKIKRLILFNKKGFRYNHKLRWAMWSFACNAAMRDGWFRDQYVNEISRQLGLNPDMNAIHARFRAQRKISKILLSLFWHKMREAHGLSTTTPYREQHRNTKVLYNPSDVC